MQNYSPNPFRGKLLSSNASLPACQTLVRHQVQIAFPLDAKSVVTGTHQPRSHLPTLEDEFSNKQPVYGQSEDGSYSAEVLKLYSQHTAKKEKDIAREITGHTGICALLEAAVDPDSFRLKIASDPTFPTLISRSDSLGLFNLIRSKFGKSSLTGRCNRTLEFFQIRQSPSEPLADFLYTFDEKFHTFQSDLESTEHPGYIKITDVGYYTWLLHSTWCLIPCIPRTQDANTPRAQHQ